MALDFARRELEILENGCSSQEDLEAQKHVTKCIMDLMEVFSNQGHSGFSAGYVANLFDRLVHFRPLTPLTGEDDEWNEVYHGRYQNKRCPRIFKNDAGNAYDSEYWYFVDEYGSAYTNVDSHQEISFPYMPGEPKLFELTPADDEYREVEIKYRKAQEEIKIKWRADDLTKEESK